LSYFIFVQVPSGSRMCYNYHKLWMLFRRFRIRFGVKFCDSFIGLLYQIHWCQCSHSTYCCNGDYCHHRCSCCCSYFSIHVVLSTIHLKQVDNNEWACHAIQYTSWLCFTNSLGQKAYRPHHKLEASFNQLKIFMKKWDSVESLFVPYIFRIIITALLLAWALQVC
jgi:hypothetical protein